jgi:hypothetical protein
MKYWTLVLLVLLSAAIARAETPNEADYPVQYEVMNANTVRNWMVGNFCTISLRDLSDKGLIFIVQRRGHGACHIPDSGTKLHGRREKNEIKLLMRDNSGKVTVERWPIVSTAETGK